MAHRLGPSDVEAYCRFVDTHASDNAGTVKAAFGYNEMLAARFEIYAIMMQAALARPGDHTYAIESLTSDLQRDVDGYVSFAQEFFHQDSCPGEYVDMTVWSQEHSNTC